MKKLATAFFVLLSFSLQAQSLFYYGNDSVSVKDFLKAYHKNNTGAKTEKAFRDYLGLYIASRLKIKDARDRGYDTLPQMVADLDNLRQQILPAYLNDKDAVDKLVEEAYTRSQKDIHLAHIFISFLQNGGLDSIAALKKLGEVQARLKSGADFARLAREYSDDPAAKTNGGDLDWITVFTLPYELERVAYATAPGKISFYKSKVGYHILKNLGERKDPGKLKLAQILLAFPPETDEQSKAVVKALADSLYNRLQKGDDFGKLAAQFSNDAISAAANGRIPDFGVGEYDPVFENTAFALPRDGAISKPFLTTHGYHIIKRLGKIPVAYSKNDRKSMQTLRTKVEQSDRIATTRAAIANRILSTPGFKKENFSESELWAFSDSVMNYKPSGMRLNLNKTSPLFHVGSQTYTVSDWINFAQTFRYKSDGSGMKPYPQLWREYLETSAVDYYQKHLENYNEEFRQQITEFNEGNLFFEIMQRQVWGPAQNDSVALTDYYNQHRSNYNWKQSADAIVFYASDAASAKDFREQLKKSPSSWHEIVAGFNEKIAADSSRFEWSQLPNPSQQAVRTGTITEPLINKSDNTASFAYIIRVYEQPAPRSFPEARGLVINDYQSQLEKSWVAELEKKYPVRMNQKVLDELIRNKKW
jgi:peptidyl-prolyl cis-trans isomerase SurA